MRRQAASLPAWAPLARRALEAARDKDYPRAIKATNAIGVRFGNNAIPGVLQAWIDTVTTQLGLDPGDRPIRLAWRKEGAAEITDADTTPSAAVWAGRMFAARLADDWDTFKALIDTCPTDEVWGANCAALLDMCAAMLRSGGTS